MVLTHLVQFEFIDGATSQAPVAPDTTNLSPGLPPSGGTPHKERVLLSPVPMRGSRVYALHSDPGKKVTLPPLPQIVPVTASMADLGALLPEPVKAPELNARQLVAELEQRLLADARLREGELLKSIEALRAELRVKEEVAAEERTERHKGLSRTQLLLLLLLAT